MRTLLLLALAATAAQAQKPSRTPLAKNEPHHHFAYEDGMIRVLRVNVPAGDTTFVHEHKVDYVWVSIGPSTLINAKQGAADEKVEFKPLDVHYTAGGFAHAVRNIGRTPFDNVTVELLGRQTNARNYCELAVDGKPLDCKTPLTTTGVSVKPAVGTDQLRASMVTLQPGRAIPLDVKSKSWVIAIDTTDVKRGLAIVSGEKWKGGVAALTTGERVVRNASARVVNLLVIATER